LGKGGQAVPEQVKEASYSLPEEGRRFFFQGQGSLILFTLKTLN